MDVSVGLFIQPLVVVHFMSLVIEQRNICRYAIAAAVMAGYALFSVCLLTLTAVSGQTSLPVARTEIQTSCDFEENICSSKLPNTTTTRLSLEEVFRILQHRSSVQGCLHNV